MNNFFDNRNFLEIIWKWKEHLIIVGVVAFLLSVVFSSSTFITPKFKSTARIYPSNNIYTFSEESSSEQLLEIIGSLEIKLRVIDAFNLSEVYKISKKEPQYLTYIITEFNENISFKKTEYETIEIQVLDPNPQRASDICDSIISFVDQKIGDIHRVKYKEVVDIAKKDIKDITQRYDSVKFRLDYIRNEYGILDYDLQVKEITRGMVKVIESQKQNTPGGKELSKWMKNLAEKGSEYEMLQKKQKSLLSQLDSVQIIYDQSLSNVYKKIVFGQRVQNPVPADKKAYPVRWLIAILTTTSSLLLALLAIFLFENFKKPN